MRTDSFPANSVIYTGSSLKSGGQQLFSSEVMAMPMSVGESLFRGWVCAHYRETGKGPMVSSSLQWNTR